MRKVFSSIVLVILMLLGIGGCLQKEETAASAVTSIVLTSDKAKITANGTESLTLTAVVKDQNNTTMSGISLDYYAGTTKLANNTFKTTTAGIYKLTAKAGTLTSNEITVTAGGNKIEITIDGTGKVKLSPEKEEYENNEISKWNKTGLSIQV